MRIYATSLHALCADRLGQREEAVALHRATLERIGAHPEWHVFTRTEALARAGLDARVAGRAPAISVVVLRLPF